MLSWCLHILFVSIAFGVTLYTSSSLVFDARLLIVVVDDMMHTHPTQSVVALWCLYADSKATFIYVFLRSGKIFLLNDSCSIGEKKLFVGYKLLEKQTLNIF